MELNGDALETLAKKLDGKAYAADLTDVDTVAALLDRVEADGDVDVLVNNAAMDYVGLLSATTAAQAHDLMQVNLCAPIELCRQAVPRMLHRGRGHIVNVSSLGAVTTGPGATLYGPAKAGLSHFTAGLRAELRGSPVETTLVQLGGVKTDMIDNIRAFGPAGRTIERFERLHILSPDMDPEFVATAITEAIEHQRRHVMLPRRIAPVMQFAEVPRRLSEILSMGIDQSAD